MAAAILMDVINPTVNMLREETTEHLCYVVEITMSDGNKIGLHFNGREDITAFIGVLELMNRQGVGDGN